MKRFVTLAPFALAIALAGCNSSSEPEVLDTNPDPMANMLNTAAPIEMPPPVKSSEIYRCKDNSIVYVDFLADDKSANIRTERDGLPTLVKAEEAGQPMTAEGYSLSGSGDEVQIAVEGGAAQRCHV